MSPVAPLKNVLPKAANLPAGDWARHHALVLRVLAALSLLVPAYGAARGHGGMHLLVHLLPMVALTLAAAWTAPGPAWRSAAASAGLMTASALAVHSSDGATEAHFMFFALLPLAAVYGSWTPFAVAVGYVLLHHFALGAALPGAVFDHQGSALGMAALHAGFVLVESFVCLTAWQVLEARRERVEALVGERTAELSRQRNLLARLAAVVESTDDAVVVMTPGGTISAWNPGAERLYGFVPAEVIGRPVERLVPPDCRAEHRGALDSLEHGHSVRLENANVRKDGSRFCALATISRITDDTGVVTGIVSITRDITERKQGEAAAVATARKLEEQADQLTRLALHDALTGLANRTSLSERLRTALARGGAGRTGLLLLDLDNFKAINDVAGHTAGDEVLVEVAARLRACVRPSDTVARLGGDEFVVLLDGVAGPEDATRVAQRILELLRRPAQIRGESFEIGASLGVALAGADPDADALVRDADTAMYTAKRAGKGTYALFAPEMHDALVTQAGLIRDLRHVTELDQLRVVYQPQVDLGTGHMIGVEALVRWEHPDRGLIPPDVFIPLAESTGAIVAIDDWVMREACCQLRSWDDAGVPPLRMAVNVSARRLVTGDLAATVAATAKAAGVELPRLEIEITETVAVEHEAEAVRAISRVRDLGALVAIDDFGMGHSALSRLQTFPVDRLKIDRTFVAPLAPGAERGSIADAMIAIGQSLGLGVLAEGVETREHLTALRTLGCGAAQGYLFSRPVGADEIARMARAGIPLAPLEELPEAVEVLEPGAVAARRERQIRTLLAELARVTGLETTYLTHIDWGKSLQRLTHARNAGVLELPEGLEVDWADTVCRRALEQEIAYTDDVPVTFPDCEAGRELGLKTYVSVPLRGPDGEVEGTLCGASTRSIALGPEAIVLMERFAELIARGVAGRSAAATALVPSSV